MTPAANLRSFPLWTCVASFVIALLLSIIPLPYVLNWLNPSWVLLVLIYWVLYRPYQLNIGGAFFIGLILDLLSNNILGQHAVLFVIISYGLVCFHKRIALFPAPQQTLLVIGLCYFEKMGIFLTQAIINQMPSSGLFWLAPLISGLLWLWWLLVRGAYS